ncbi:MAG: hypothetical protein ACFCU7_15360 [Pleurocapsa sp.]
MESLLIIFRVFVGSAGITFLVWLIVHFNGKTLLGIFDLIVARIVNRSQSHLTAKSWLSIATETEVILIGLCPIAIASLISTMGQNCHNSIYSFLITEAIVFGLFLFIPNRIKSGSNFFGERYYRSNGIIFLIATIWCLAFSVWGYLAIDPEINQGVDRLLVNGNGDMWFYVRRFAAYTVNNVSFDNQPACFYLQNSPKKLSSFIGSIIVYGSPSTVLGITWFQGLLGCSLFLSLFGNWQNFNYQGQSLSKKGTIGVIIWAIASPSVFWLVISSYLSNALFVTIFILSLTAARRVCLNHGKYPVYTEPILLFSFILNVFSFYIILLPVALIFYLATLLVYRYEKYWHSYVAMFNFSKLMLFAGISILICSILFKHQINLNEVSVNLNALKEHGKNFVPLNPWSLVQEKPKPMPNIKDFGVWFNLVVGTIFSGFVLKTIYRNLLDLKNNKRTSSVYFKDLIAAALVVGVYLVYLLAYIPLEYTYRLGKFAVSILYPLATVATLPTVLWFRDRFYHQKARIFQSTCLVLLILHIILHIDKTLYLQAQPIGRYQLVSTNHLADINSLTIIRCQNSSISQKYQKILGLDLAKQYRDITINVITDPNLINNFPASEAIVKGTDVLEKAQNLCIFKIDL